MWRIKLIAKLVLARLPLPYSFWRSIGLFKLGSMDRTVYQANIFYIHLKRAYPKGPPKGLRLLELGPGDGVSSAILGFSEFAERTYLIDSGKFATEDKRVYLKLIQSQKKNNKVAPNISDCESLDHILLRSRGVYYTEGLKSFQHIPTGSIDFLWSHSVLEHINLAELSQTIREIKRVLKPGGLTSHNIDFQDHLCRGLNNLRFSDRVWEGKWFQRSGFYTNRVRAYQMHNLFKAAGFEVLEENFGRWCYLPISRDDIDQKFSDLSEDELLIRTSHIVLRA